MDKISKLHRNRLYKFTGSNKLRAQSCQVLDVLNFIEVNRVKQTRYSIIEWRISP